MVAQGAVPAQPRNPGNVDEESRSPGGATEPQGFCRPSGARSLSRCFPRVPLACRSLHPGLPSVAPPGLKARRPADDRVTPSPRGVQSSPRAARPSACGRRRSTGSRGWPGRGTRPGTSHTRSTVSVDLLLRGQLPPVQDQLAAAGLEVARSAPFSRRSVSCFMSVGTFIPAGMPTIATAMPCPLLLLVLAASPSAAPSRPRSPRPCASFVLDLARRTSRRSPACSVVYV